MRWTAIDTSCDLREGFDVHPSLGSGFQGLDKVLVSTGPVARHNCPTLLVLSVTKA
jgi:hypothetical protein